MPTKQLRIVVTGANPYTATIPINLANDGSGVSSVTLGGQNSGVDMLQVFLDEYNLSSNQAQEVWQGANGAIAVSPITGYMRAGNGTIQSGLNAGSYPYQQTYNSLMFNTHPKELLPGDPHDSGNQANPMVNNATTTAGTYAGDVVVNGDSGGPRDFSFVGSFVVAQAGNITFTMYSNQGALIGCPGASFVSGAQVNGGVNNTHVMGYSVIAGRNGSWPGGNTATDSFTLNFPAPGVYPFEILFSSGFLSLRSFALLANGSVIRPASMVGVPAAPAPGTGQLVITPNSAGPDITGAGTRTFTVNVSGIKFTSTKYLPLREGTTGHVFVSNSSSSNGFDFPSIPNGNNVDGSKAAGLFSITGDNDSWKNCLSIGWDGSAYRLNYSAPAVDNGIEGVTLTISAKNIAWFNQNSGQFDVYNPTSQGGGSSVQVLVRYLINPSISSIGPTTVTGDGSAYTFAINLSKPIPPIQSAINGTFTGGPGLTVTGQQTQFNSNGWITGWSVTATTSYTSADVSSYLACTLVGNITYLRDDQFVTEDVTFVNGQHFGVTIQAAPDYSGGSGDSGDPISGDCPDLEMYVDTVSQVKELKVGDRLVCLNDSFVTTELHLVEAFRESSEECYRITAANGAAVIVSKSTPVPTVEEIARIRAGQTEDKELKLYASQIEPGMHVITLIDGVEIKDSEVISVENVGVRRVGRVSVGGRNFAAGVDPHKQIFTHNVMVASK
jgi:hypothetical protein